MDKLDAYNLQQEEEYRQQEIEVAKFEELAKEWRAKWPNACKSCRGQGMFTRGGSYWHPPEHELCSRLEADETRTCCRCGKPNALDEEFNGPCKFCGWNFDDMEPSYY